MYYSFVLWGICRTEFDPAYYTKEKIIKLETIARILGFLGAEHAYGCFLDHERMAINHLNTWIIENIILKWVYMFNFSFRVYKYDCALKTSDIYCLVGWIYYLQPYFIYHNAKSDLIKSFIMKIQSSMDFILKYVPKVSLIHSFINRSLLGSMNSLSIYWLFCRKHRIYV